MTLKPLKWLADSLDDLRQFSLDARHEAGYQLERVQAGKEPEDWKPMPTVGLGVKEIRVHVDGAYRVLYVARFSEAVYVLHCFQKKSQKTPKPDIELARNRFRALIRERKQQ